MNETNTTDIVEEKQNYFQRLNGINVSGKIEKKNGLNYLSWAWAWAELKKIHPDATSKVYETETGCIYFTDGKTAWVKTSVTVNDIEHIEYLPIMDFKNRSFALEQITSMDANKAIQRCITKCIARHGIGLYIYAGEDMPEEKQEEKEESKFIDKNQIKELMNLLEFKQDKEKELLKKYTSFSNIPSINYDKIIKYINS